MKVTEKLCSSQPKDVRCFQSAHEMSDETEKVQQSSRNKRQNKFKEETVNFWSETIIWIGTSG